VSINGKQKGKRGELELVKKLKEYGYDCKRSVQYCGANGDADVIGLPRIHIECKRVERLNIDDAMLQAIRDRREGEYPAVFHRKNNHEWLVTMRLNDWIEIYREWRV
jgi:Holliday junction resolvase